MTQQQKLRTTRPPNFPTTRTQWEEYVTIPNRRILYKFQASGISKPRLQTSGGHILRFQTPWRHHLEPKPKWRLLPRKGFQSKNRMTQVNEKNTTKNFSTNDDQSKEMAPFKTRFHRPIPPYHYKQKSEQSSNYQEYTGQDPSVMKTLPRSPAFMKSLTITGI